LAFNDLSDGYTGCNTKKLHFNELLILLHFLALKERKIPAQGKALGQILQ
jgi:hypothetical protein